MAQRLDFFPHEMDVHQKLDRLIYLSPDDGAAIEMLITDVLKRRWPAAVAWRPRRLRLAAKF